jgi:pimeloyl-ACP methyl ester carboxylesterase
MSSWSRAAIAALTALLLAGCSSSGSNTVRTPTFPADPTCPQQQVPTGVAPAKPQACGRGAHPFWLPGPDGTLLEANAYGSGAAAAVFLHQAGRLADMCGFWPYAKWLADREHVQVVLVNRCTYGRSTCELFQTGDRGIVSQVQPAVDWARRHGAQTVTLVGASAGGADALQAGGVVEHVAAVVDLSGDSADTGADDRADARRLHLPVLFAIAPGDSVVSVAEVRARYRLVPGHDKRLVVVRRSPGAHGWDLLLDPATGQFTALAHVVADWVTGRRH